jgi:hypothetical protein
MRDHLEMIVEQNPCHVSASNATIHERNSDTWEFGKGALSGTLYSAAVLQSKNSAGVLRSCGAAVKRKKVKVGGGRRDVK